MRFHLRRRQDENEKIMLLLPIRSHIETFPLRLSCDLLFTCKKEFKIHIYFIAPPLFYEGCFQLCGMSSSFTTSWGRKRSRISYRGWT